MIQTNGFTTKLLDPTDQEAIALNNMAVDFMKNLDRNPEMAKGQFKNGILPHMMRAIRTVKTLDEHLEAHAIEIKKLLKANVAMIELLKKHSIDMPNFGAIEEEVIRDHEERYGKRV